MSRSRAVTEDGVEYRDLNGNGRLDPYEDPRLTPEERAQDLLGRLSLEEKAGLLFHPTIAVGEPGDHDTEGRFGSSPREQVGVALLNHFNVHALPAPREAARWHNALQELAEETPHGIPVTISTDPRHSFSQNTGASLAAGSMSQWPEPLGFGAIASPELLRDFGDVVRREYVALGIRAALHPQVDLTTEPRWARQVHSFGQDSRLTSELVVAFLEGLQGSSIGPDSVAATTKHFPGGGPQKDGEDPHFEYGREQVYPGGRFEEHLAPFRAAIAAGTAAIMPYYGMPIGLELDGEPVEEVGFSFNRRIITGLLREELGYDGVILTDWGLITDVEIMGKPFPARAWGVEHLSPIERMAKLLDAGVDQFGGEQRPDLVLELVRSGRIEESRLDDAVRRLLLVKFRLGLFDDPYLDEDEAERVVGSPGFREAGHRAQAESVTVLKNEAVLPLAGGVKLYIEGVDRSIAEQYGAVVDEPAEADVALVRLQAPFEERDHYFLEAMFHQGSLEFAGDDAERIRSLAASVPLVVDVGLDRAAVLTPIDAAARALTVTYGASDAALLDALTGRIAPRGRLPFELPRSMDAVRASRPDVPSDTENPLYEFGHGLTV
ncbi:glycoside hydrolase family 3 protein [Naasia sp. SYSU D00948]|uniref:glycoside hydrolase family 3 protein n=1 Tax=Naasia sp. SYSU D00948 TaxID=2817379 RepID=UPI001B312E3B|nr:glycoside hydrolase family 3 N-terminal domain-containing protein [Naasia sp. SYSU D00948]